ncbi:hypothetical protein ACSFXN_18355 [Planococcus sp. 1R117A]|uniref:hypothetical protein n=1 Tax=Planococcus sp. 1R117A TaxID=3447020 RepID=UPI003EDBF845
MKSRKKKLVGLIALGFLSFVLISNVFDAKINVSADSTEMAPKKTEKKVAEEVQNGGRILLEPTEEMWKNAINMANGQKQSDNQLQKWIIRGIMEESVEGNTANMGDVVKAAKKKYAFETAWLKLATEQYKITYTDAEVDEWIKNGPDMYPVPAMEAQAKALGLTLEEMNHSYDRDFYVKWVIWDKLLPVLAEKYNIDLENVELSADAPSPFNVVVEKYEQEVNQYLSKKK